MENAAVAQETPEVPCVLELNPALGRVAVEGDPVHESVLSSTLKDLTNIMQLLGIPGHPTLQIVPFRSPSARSDELVRFSVHGHLCSYPTDVLTSVWSCMTSRPWNADIPDPAGMLAQFQAISEWSVEDLSKIFYDFLGFFCTEILFRQPSLLLDSVQVVYYIQQLAPLIEAEAPTPDTAWLLPVLRTVLDCKIAIGDTATVAKVLSSMKDRPREVITEELIETLLEASSTQDILICLSRDYLRQLTMLEAESGLNMFVEMRSTLWKATGITYPSFRFVINDAGYPPPRFAFRINHILTLPWIGMDKANQQTNELAYFMACLNYVLQLNSHCFVRRQLVQERLASHKKSYPALVDAITAQGITPEYITGVLRALILANRSIKDIRLILERILDYAYLSDDPARNDALDLPFTASGKVDSTWFRDPMHAVDYIREALPTYED